MTTPDTGSRTAPGTGPDAAGWRPALREDVHAVPTDSGVRFFTDRGESVLTGQAVHAWIERLAPFLDGGQTLGDLTASLPGDRARWVASLVTALVEQGIVRRDGPVPPPVPGEAQETAYLRHRLDAPADAPAALERYRATTALVTGDGPLLAPVVRAAARSGLRRLLTAPTGTAPGDHSAPAPGTGTVVDVLPPVGADDSWVPLVASAGLVLHVAAAPDPARAAALERACARAGVPLLQAVLADGAVWIRPTTVGGPGWSEGWRRVTALRPDTATAPAAPWPGGAADTVLAGLLVHDAFRLLTGVDQDAGRPLLLRVDPGDPAGTEHRFLAAAFPAAPPGRDVRAFRAATAALRAAPALTEEEFSRRAARLVDPYTGVLGEVGEGGLAQLPVCAATATVADPSVPPGPGRAPLVVAGIGEDLAEARRRAALRALAVHGGLSLDPRRLVTREGDPLPESAAPPDAPRARVRAVRLADGEPVLVPAADAFPGPRVRLSAGPVEVSAGRADGAPAGPGALPPRGTAAGLSWDDAVLTGLLDHCALLTLDEAAEGSATVRRIAPGDPVSAPVAALWDLLAATGRTAGAYLLTGRLGVPTAVGTLEGTPIAYAAAAEAGAALREALLGTLAATQAAAHGEPVYAPPAPPGGWRPPGTPVAGHGDGAATDASPAAPVGAPGPPDAPRATAAPAAPALGAVAGGSSASGPGAPDRAASAPGLAAAAPVASGLGPAASVPVAVAPDPAASAQAPVASALGAVAGGSSASGPGAGDESSAGPDGDLPPGPETARALARVVDALVRHGYVPTAVPLDHDRAVHALLPFVVHTGIGAGADSAVVGRARDGSAEGTPAVADRTGAGGDSAVAGRAREGSAEVGPAVVDRVGSGVAEAGSAAAGHTSDGSAGTGPRAADRTGTSAAATGSAAADRTQIGPAGISAPVAGGTAVGDTAPRPARTGGAVGTAAEGSEASPVDSSTSAGGGGTGTPPAPPAAGGAVHGHGVLARALREGAFTRGTRMLAAAADTWDDSGYARVRQEAREAGLPWLPVRAEQGTVVIGPLEVPGEPGCHDCAQTRRRRAHTDPAAWRRLRELHGERLATRPSPLLTGLAADTAAALAADEARLHAAGERPRTRSALLRLDLDRLTATRHPFLPDPLCPTCGGLPPDAPEAAVPELVPRPTIAPGVPRTRPLLDELDRLRETYVDPVAGLVPEIGSGVDGGLVIAVAGIRLRGHEDSAEPGIGRTHTHRASAMVGLLEALERYAGVEPGGRRTTVTGSYRDLADRALDPRALGLHPPAHHTRSGFPYRPFEPDAPANWVWGYSFGRDEAVLVPETTAYACAHGPGRYPPFCSETSNGCALGGCWEEAALHGLLEVAERDAFLLTWYGRIPAPALALDAAVDRLVPLHAAAVTAATGYRVTVYDTTVDHGVPTAWALARAPHGVGAAEGPATVSAAGAGLTLEAAARNALAELGPIVTDLVRRFPERADEAARMARDPERVTRMEHHGLLYGDPEAARRLAFLGPGEPVAPGGRAALPGGPDLTATLRAAVAGFAAAGMDTVVVDQTTPEHRAGGLVCVKVLAPGTVPMTFGHHLRRTEGLPRLGTVPWLLGHAPRPLRPEDLNPHPHPFP